MEQEAGRPTMVAPAPATVPVAQNRWALVIGNAAYGVEIGPLQNPANDATDMAMTLQQLGFEVMVLLDATRPQMEEGIAALRCQLRLGGVGLFYFAGHGAQVEGTNYLIPLGATAPGAGWNARGCAGDPATLRAASAGACPDDRRPGWRRDGPVCAGHGLSDVGGARGRGHDPHQGADMGPGS